MIERFVNIIKVFLVLILVFGCKISYSQTCTVTGTSPLNWTNPGPSCVEGGTAGGNSVSVIPAGFTLNFNSNGDTWSGTRIDVYGTLNISFNVTINSSITVYSGGQVNLQAKLSLGTSAGCGYTMTIFTGGTVDVGSTGSDRLAICGVDLMKGSGACNDCLGTNSGTCAYNGNPYCEPASGFVGPLGYTQGGYNGTLPVKLLFFNAALEDEVVVLRWATAMEENFDKFIVERSQTGTDFQPIGEVEGVGRSIYDIETNYALEDKTPLLGFNYYRLKALDLDGTSEYFGVRAVKLIGPKELSIYPNPSSGKSFSFGINFNPSERDQVLLINNFGVELLRLPITETENNISFESDLSPGVYIVKYISSDFELVSRLMISH